MNEYIIDSINDCLTDCDSHVEIVTSNGQTYEINRALNLNENILSVNVSDNNDTDFIAEIPFNHITAIENI